MHGNFQPPSKLEKVTGPFLALAGSGLLVYSAGLVVIHALGWLKTGAWPAFTTSQLFAVLGWEYPSQDMVGLQRIIDYVMQCGAATCAASLGAVMIYAGGILIGKSDTKYREYRRAIDLAEQRRQK